MLEELFDIRDIPLALSLNYNPGDFVAIGINIGCKLAGCKEELF